MPSLPRVEIMSPKRTDQFQVAASALALLSALALAGCNPAPKPDEAAPLPEASPVAAPTAEVTPGPALANSTTVATAAATPAPVLVGASPPGAKPTVQTSPVVPVKPATAVAPPPAARPPMVTAGLPAGAGRDVVQKACGSCHGIDTVTAVGRTPQQWADIIGQMQNMGLSASDEDLATIHAYLSRQLPPK